MTAIIVESQPCRDCGRALSPAEIRMFGLGSVRSGFRCVECTAIHLAAETAMCQGLTRTMLDMPIEEHRCPECKLTFAEIWAKTGVENAFVQTVDGERRIMCAPCSDRYDRLANRWKGTEYEHVRKLRGNK